MDSLQSDLSLLRHTLQTLDRTRSSLPTLLRTFSSPPTSQDLSVLYKSRSTECWSSIKTLREELQGVGDILSRCEGRDGGIVVEERDRNQEGATLRWEEVEMVLGGVGGKKKERNWSEGGGREGESLEEGVKRWDGGKLQVGLESGGREFRVVVKGLMRVGCLIKDWEGVQMIERVVCFGLKEGGVSVFCLFLSLFR